MQKLTRSASFGGIYFGYDTGWIGGVLGQSDQFIDTSLTISHAILH
jgi:hypothetical protein